MWLPLQARVAHFTLTPANPVGFVNMPTQQNTSNIWWDNTLLPKLPFAIKNVKNTKPRSVRWYVCSALSDGALMNLQGNLNFLKRKRPIKKIMKGHLWPRYLATDLVLINFFRYQQEAHDIEPKLRGRTVAAHTERSEGYICNMTLWYVLMISGLVHQLDDPVVVSFGEVTRTILENTVAEMSKHRTK